MAETTYECPGRLMPEPEGWVWCYRAGHPCPPAEAVEQRSDGAVSTSWRCPCCGDLKLAMWMSSGVAS